MLELVGLPALADRLPAALSGGQQQRVALARALVFEPAALLLDEPLSALDAATRVAMRDEIRRIQREQGIATLLITHDQDEALSLADRVAVMRDGRLVQVAPPQASTTARPSAFVATFVGRANVLDGTVAGRTASTRPSAGSRRCRTASRRAPVSLLIRPERVEPGAVADGENVIDVQVSRTRSSARRASVEVGRRRPARDRDGVARCCRHRVRIPRDAIQFLPTATLKEDHHEVSTVACPSLRRRRVHVARTGVAQTTSIRPSCTPARRRSTRPRRRKAWWSRFDTGPTWANWAAQFAAFKKRYPDVEIVYNDLGSAATVVALDKARNRPQADTAYYFAASAVDAVKKGVVAPFKPVNFDKLPAVFREPTAAGSRSTRSPWPSWSTRSWSKNVPQSWADLMKPEYKNSIVYLDPRSTGVGQVLTFAANFGNGGDMNNVQPGLDYLGKLHQSGNVLRVLGTTPYAQFVKGEIPIWISYENDGLKAKYTDGLGDAVAVVIPKEASAAAPYGISLVEKGPNPNAGQAVAQLHHDRLRPGHLRAGLRAPVGARASSCPTAWPTSCRAAPQVRPLDVQAAAAKKAEIDAGWAKATGTK